jgi:hypothetical protein
MQLNLKQSQFITRLAFCLLNGTTPKKTSGLVDLSVMKQDDLKCNAFLCRVLQILGLKTTKANNTTKSYLHASLCLLW